MDHNPTEPAKATAPRFRRRFVATPASPALLSRQVELTTKAHRALGSIEAVRAFLNEHNAALAARPIDVAGESADGLLLAITQLEVVRQERA